MSGDNRSKSDAGTGGRHEGARKPSEGSGKSGDWWEDAEYVIDEYWDDKFGFQFGYLDWRSLGLGC